MLLSHKPTWNWRLVELLLHVDHWKTLSHYRYLSGGIIDHELRVHHARLHDEERSIHELLGIHWLHMLRVLALSELLLWLHLRHLPVLLEHHIRVPDSRHLAWHADKLAGHLGGHLARRSALLDLLELLLTVHLVHV